MLGPVSSVNVPYCSTAAFPISLSAQSFPNVPDEQIPAYLWEVPDGWGVSGATLIPSFAITPVGFRLYQGTRNITLTPQAGGDVTLRVFPYSSTCNEQNLSVYLRYRLIGTAGSIQIRRTPTLTLTTTDTRTLFCGDRTPRTYTAQASQSQGLGAYDWTYPSGWTVQGAATGASITLVPSGSGGGAVGVSARLTCSPTVGTTITATPIAVPMRPEVATPTLGGERPASLCNGVSTELTAQAVGAQSYEWTVSDPSLQITYLTPDHSRVRLTAPATGSLDGQIRVRARNDNSGCTPSAQVSYNFRLGGAGAPAEVFVNGFYPTSGGQAQYIPPLACGSVVTFQLPNGQPADVTGYFWTTTGTILTGQGSPRIEVRYPSGSAYATALVQPINACGTSESYLVDVLFRADCNGGGTGGGPPSDCLICSTSGSRAVYPNPADDKLYVEQSGGEVILFNAQGQPVQGRTAKAGRVQLTVKHLPAGLYYLLYYPAAGQAKREQVEIRH